MSIIRPFFEGIGTGAGVAWPLFGIISSSLSLGIGSAFALTLGLICSSIFLLVSIPVFYLAYQRFQEEEKKLNDKFLGLLKKLTLKSKQFLDECSQEDLLRIIGEKSEQNIHYDHELKDDQSFSNFIACLAATCNKNNFTNLPDKEKNNIIFQALYVWMHSAEVKKSLKSVSNMNLLYAGFLGFVGVFGSIAGCSAGLMGLLGGLGLLTGFSAFPLVGLIVLTLASGFGIYTAISATSSTIEKDNKNQLCKKMKGLITSLGTYQLSKEDKVHTVETTDDVFSYNLESTPKNRSQFVNPGISMNCLFCKDKENIRTEEDLLLNNESTSFLLNA
ncbi:hypothetical protein [Legionella cardiaca]|uniref:Transmembrane protein n=1 Tax=Legionella cardiaca TaxID=1071983 RepID=A0ABY8ARY6_9GAMM|nr:hypothetical protein [Legionella cardiaca]WED42051.1 hypothetical protein PXX05_08905 [Legionella cardiaca]